MKKIFTLLMTLVLIFSVSDVALANQAKATVSGNKSAIQGDKVEYTVSLADCGKANTLGIEFIYDDEVLTKDTNKCAWLVDGSLTDIDPVKNIAVWGTKKAQNLNMDVFKLVFNVNANATIGETEVTVKVTVKNNEEVVGEYTDTLKVNVGCRHQVEEWENSSKDNHSGDCVKCTEKVTEAHKWNSGTVTQAPTASKDGVKTYTCTVCEATKTETIKATGETEKPESGNKPGPGETIKPESGNKPGTGETTKPEDSKPESKPETKPESGTTTPDSEATTPEADTNQGGTTTKPESTKPGNTKPSGTTTPNTEESAPAVEMKETVVKEKVEEIQKAAEGKDVVVEMKQADGKVATVVPVEILEAVKGKDVNVVLDMGEYSWIINGKDVAEEGLKDINLQVALDAKNVDEKVVKEIAGEDEVRQISLTHDGEFNFKAKLKLNMGKENAGKFGNLYYHNNGKLEFMNAAKVDAEGNVELEFEHASDYVVVVGRDRTAEEQNQDTTGDVDVPSTEEGTDTKPSNGGNAGTIVIVILVIAAIAGGAYYFLKKKN